MSDLSYDYREKKIVVTLAVNIPLEVAFNVIGHLGISIGFYANDNFMGKSHIMDKSGKPHIGISKYPVIITQAKQQKLRKAINEARESNDILMVDFPRQMLITEHDDELVKSLGESLEEDLEYLGAIFYGKSKYVDSITGKFSLWRSNNVKVN
ncbi:hypothetical protein BJV85_002928 [Clostridium acetobutylicum]|uniref:DUF2000 domain-containing protein n=1 Tax=Clostridium acetobutylicum (strain ATCC 824 / DSM 792 / JCM 1419 / IAM 19013 / LMG 5710 / NBRC 13948 / NRRL B-527 / VKM B-1787 / 2291 / W) TaxID=272562 RepID=Q97K48_CLOAB|nr:MULTISPECIES: DUF2000 domain-containing protein [Clostridium]AAK79047.1 Hypothetical protein CA_C1073 [Clostridium acetobutylicum ATCC 824]ADZ20122.1 Conserved hypothetical protein [Clostridium acetobutylicum EA 2018]AEI31597.1 hypothetical protein SMB_G1091 [Clostridium acetobutylicum DSM 1731]AWV81698.1 DUF2000 domain-containing protein [Clostridium acetobutylicum]KHD34553.1 hypothetical protein NL50_16605 [Clostridium acetobutylicum]